MSPCAVGISGYVCHARRSHICERLNFAPLHETMVVIGKTLDPGCTSHHHGHENLREFAVVFGTACFRKQALVAAPQWLTRIHMQPPSSSDRHYAHEVAAEAESLVRLWDRAEDWAVPRISPSQVKVLGLLRYRGQMSLSALSEEIGAIPSSTSRLCDRLAAAGLLEREVPAEDRRAVRISLSKQGWRRLESFDRARREDFSFVLEKMTPQTRHALLEGLRAFGAAAQEVRELPA